MNLLQRSNTISFRFVASICAILVIFLSFDISAKAGGINGPESRAIGFYNSTFYYDGKYYVASDSAKAAAYAKMAQDGVDLTDEQVDSYILNARRNMVSGIDQGILVEIPNPNGGGDNNAENNADQSDTDKDDIVNLEDDDDDDDKDDDDWTDAEDDDDDVKPSKKTDRNKEIKDAESAGDAAEITSKGDSKTVTIEHKQKGSVKAINKEGYVVYEGKLPIKNTGYNTKMTRLVFMGLGIAFVMAVIGAIVWLRKSDTQ